MLPGEYLSAAPGGQQTKRYPRQCVWPFAAARALARFAAAVVTGLLLSSPALSHNGSVHSAPGDLDHAAEDALVLQAIEAAAVNGVVPGAQVRAARIDPDPEDFDIYGSWSNVKAWPHVAVSAANLPDGRVLTWSSSEIDGFPSGNPEFTHATV